MSVGGPRSSTAPPPAWPPPPRRSRHPCPQRCAPRTPRPPGTPAPPLPVPPAPPAPAAAPASPAHTPRHEPPQGSGPPPGQPRRRRIAVAGRATEHAHQRAVFEIRVGAPEVVVLEHLVVDTQVPVRRPAGSHPAAHPLRRTHIRPTTSPPPEGPPWLSLPSEPPPIPSQRATLDHAANSVGIGFTRIERTVRTFTRSPTRRNHRASRPRLAHLPSPKLQARKTLPRPPGSPTQEGPSRTTRHGSASRDPEPGRGHPRGSSSSRTNLHSPSSNRSIRRKCTFRERSSEPSGRNRFSIGRTHRAPKFVRSTTRCRVVLLCVVFGGVTSRPTTGSGFASCASMPTVGPPRPGGPPDRDHQPWTAGGRPGARDPDDDPLLAMERSGRVVRAVDDWDTPPERQSADRSSTEALQELRDRDRSR